jgi:hypothetical protein
MHDSRLENKKLLFLAKTWQRVSISNEYASNNIRTLSWVWFMQRKYEYKEDILRNESVELC